MNFVKVQHPHHPLAEKCETLYLSAFPDYERKPINFLYLHQVEGQSDMFAVQNDKQEFIGLVITIFDQYTVILEYLAVDPEHRNQNYGSQILNLLSQHYPQHQIFLEIERVHVEAKDKEIRQKRRAFYERNGFHFLNQSINFFTTTLDLMSNRESFSYDAYIQPYIHTYGPNITNDIYFI